MSTGINTSHAIVETYRDSEGNSAIARIENMDGLFGSAMQIRLVNCGPKSGAFWLARHKDERDTNDYILLLPSSRWEQDARDAGWKLVTKLSTHGHEK